MGIKAYALVGFFIISLLFTQYAFAQFAGCGPNEIRNVEGECVSAFGPSVMWDKFSYKICDIGIITFNGQEENTDPNLIQIFFIQVTSDSDPTGVEVVMIESGNDTGVFSGEVQLCGNLNVSEGDKVYVSYGNIGDVASIESTTTSITVSTDRSSYNDGDTIMVSGKVSDRLDNFPVTLSIISPLGDTVTIEQLDVGYDNTFNTELRAGGPLWEYDGIYTVKVLYGSEARSAETTFNFDTGALIFVYTDKLSYNDGDTVRISGNVEIIQSDVEVPVTIIIVDPVGDITAISQVYPSSYGSFLLTITAGGAMQITGDYEVRAQYGAQKSSTIFYFVGITITAPTSPNTVFIPSGSSVPGCENYDRCFIPSEITVNVGDTIKWENKDSAAHTVTSGSATDGPDGTFDSNMLMSGQTFSHTFRTSGEYPYFDMLHPWQAGTVVVKGIPSSGIVDTVPPLLLTPSDMTVDATDSFGARVDYSVKAIDDNDGILRPNCSPSSGSVFPIGKTTVTCSATDYSGNSDRKSFLITVNPPDVLIPSWVRDVAGFWCGDEIDDASFIEAIQYLINNDVIIVPTTVSSGSGSQEIPNWVKSNACWWSQGLITNSDFASGLQYLIGQGIIRV